MMAWIGFDDDFMIMIPPLAKHLRTYGPCQLSKDKDLLQTSGSQPNV
jgi:hypothetical protein